MPKLRVAGLAPNTPGEVALPETGTVSVGLEASEVMVTVPVKDPATVGAKVTVKVVLWEGLRVSGGAIPLS